MQERWKRIGLMYGHCESTHPREKNMTTNYVTRFNSGGTPVDTSAPIFDNNGLVA